ncbi:hypothetical protein E2C01_087386 [Portunus trituberculatus]|uniref:Uncharacterized protein n=1 Tax=Portunus trituberculatus TaxID=210409 RepID=A0A5B7JDW8_PORTR|nr:hypothetical protein [Portunus trituberculatus]
MEANGRQHNTNEHDYKAVLKQPSNHAAFRKLNKKNLIAFHSTSLCSLHRLVSYTLSSRRLISLTHASSFHHKN